MSFRLTFYSPDSPRGRSPSTNWVGTLGLHRAPSALQLNSHSVAQEFALFVASEKEVPPFSLLLDLTIKALVNIK